MMTLQIVENYDQLIQVRALLRKYADTRKNDPALLSFPEEIKNLPGEYAPPDGGLMLAYSDGTVAGCVALRRLDHEVCEMKRLYVLPRFRGRGIGRHLVEAILKQAHMMGYLRMRLDSIPGMGAAQTLYKSVGFYEIDPYRDNPNEGTAYYEIELHDR